MMNLAVKLLTNIHICSTHFISIYVNILTDFRKQLLLNEFKTLSKGKSKEELLPLVFALSQKAKQAGIQFTKQDCEMIYKQIVPGGNIPE